MRILGNRLLLSPLPARETSPGGILLPQAQTGDVMHYWRVEAVGTGKRLKHGELVPPEFAVGDLVITPLHFSHTTLEDGTNRKIVDCDQIEGKLVEEGFQPTIVQPDI
jgi:co-chaperonin GroES (HSP10)